MTTLVQSSQRSAALMLRYEESVKLKINNLCIVFTTTYV
jgi:hypothetical protein